MDKLQFHDISHPNIQWLRKYSLYHSQTLRHTLTNNEFIDNVLVAISLFVLVILLKDMITRIVYARPRFSVARDTITYFSQARIVLLDNSFLLRWVRKLRLFDVGHYTQRNHTQYNLVMLATLGMFIVELGLVVPGLPANRLIHRDSDQMVRWESQYLDEGRIILPRERPCTVAPVLEGTNVKSESSWSYCQDDTLVRANSAQFPMDKMVLALSNPETAKGVLVVALRGGGIIVTWVYSVYVPLHKDEIALVWLSDNASTLVRNLQRNFDLLYNVTGLRLNSTLSSRSSNNELDFQVNVSQVKPLASSFPSSKVHYAGIWVGGIVQGILSLRSNVNGSQLYEVGGYVEEAVPLKKTKILIGAYVGTLVPAFLIVALTAGTVVVQIVVRIFLRSPPGGAWELLEAHRRDHGDRILAGPPGSVIKIQEKGDRKTENLEKNEELVD